MATLKETIIEKIAGSAQTVSDKVVDTLVGTEVDRRAGVVIGALIGV